MMARALKRSSSPRGLRFSSWVQLIGVVVIILSGSVGVGPGAGQPRPGLPPTRIDCRYPVRLIRDRVVALTLRSPSFRDRDPQEDVVLNLIRETHAACTADAASLQTLDHIEEQLRAHVQQNARESEVRRELLAP